MKKLSVAGDVVRKYVSVKPKDKKVFSWTTALARGIPAWSIQRCMQLPKGHMYMYVWNNKNIIINIIQHNGGSRASTSYWWHWTRSTITILNNFQICLVHLVDNSIATPTRTSHPSLPPLWLLTMTKGGALSISRETDAIAVESEALSEARGGGGGGGRETSLPC